MTGADPKALVAIQAFLRAGSPRDVILHLGRLGQDRARPAPEVEIWLGAGGWVRGRLRDLDARTESVVLVEEEGQALFLRLDDVRAARVVRPETVLDALSDGRYEPIEDAALTMQSLETALRGLGDICRERFGIELEVPVEAATTPSLRQATLSATRALVTLLEALGEDREGAGELARRLDAVVVEAARRADIRLDHRRLVYMIDPEEGPQGRLRPERLRRNVISLFDR